MPETSRRPSWTFEELLPKTHDKHGQGGISRTDCGWSKDAHRLSSVIGGEAQAHARYESVVGRQRQRRQHGNRCRLTDRQRVLQARHELANTNLECGGSDRRAGRTIPGIDLDDCTMGCVSVAGMLQKHWME